MCQSPNREPDEWLPRHDWVMPEPKEREYVREPETALATAKLWTQNRRVLIVHVQNRIVDDLQAYITGAGGVSLHVRSATEALAACLGRKFDFFLLGYWLDSEHKGDWLATQLERHVDPFSVFSLAPTPRREFPDWVQHWGTQRLDMLVSMLLHPDIHTSPN